MNDMSRPAPGSPTPSPSQLRDVLGENLRRLVDAAGSVSQVCRNLDINRTQFNRYLSGESFPRPDVLARICDFFAVDARILLEPLDDVLIDRAISRSNAHMQEFVGLQSIEIDEAVFPSGFYRFSRRSFLDPSQFVLGMVFAYRMERRVYLRGFEPRVAMDLQGLPLSARAREFRGQVIAQDGGLACLMSRRGSMTSSFNFLSRTPSFENNFWLGYTIRTMGESHSGQRAQRLVYEHLGDDTGAILDTARRGGLVSEAELQPYHRTLLKPDQPFS